MKQKAAVVPSPHSKFVPLGRTQTGRLFRKQLLRHGSFAHPNIPGEKLVIDEDVIDSIVKNFTDRVCDIVQVPIVDDNNGHTENPKDNIGEVIAVEKTPTGLDVLIDARDDAAAGKLGKTLLGASALLHLNYKNTETDSHVGPTLLHAAITNRPFIADLTGFEEVIAASSDLDKGEVAILSASEPDQPDDPSNAPGNQEDKVQTLEELKKELKAAHNIDLDEALAEVERAKTLDEELAELRNQEDTDDEETEPTLSDKDLAPALAALQKAGIIKLSNGGPASVTAEDVGRAVVELANRNTLLETTVAGQKSQIDGLAAQAEKDAKLRATREVDDLVKMGRVLPAQRDDLVELSLTNRPMFDRLVPKDAIVELSERGVQSHDDNGIDVDAEIARLTGSNQKGS